MIGRLAAAALVLAVAGRPCAELAAAEAPRRVASLNLSADELLVQMLPPERVIAVTRWADDAEMSTVAGRVPAAAARLPRADLERLIALRPDLVVVSEYTDADFLHLLEKSGLRHHRLRGLASLPGIEAAIRELGAAVGAPEAAERLVSRMQRLLSELASRLRGAPPVRVLYWANPHTAGAGTAFDTLITTAGGANVGRELGLSGIVPLAGERAFEAQPDVWLVTAGSGTRQALLRHPLLSQTRAAREGRILEIPNRLLVTLSDQAADACWWLASRLHPERVPEALPPGLRP